MTDATYEPPAIADVLEPDPPFDDTVFDAVFDAREARDAYEEAAAAIEAETGERPTDDELPPPPSYDEVAVEAVARWKVTDLGSAGWALAKFAEAQEVIDAAVAQAGVWRERLLAEIAKVDEWEQASTAGARRKAGFFEGHLQRWALANRTDKQKSFKLPGGTVTTSASGPTFEIIDMAAAVRLASEHGAETKTTTNVTALKQAVTIDDYYVTNPDGEAVDARVEFVRTNSEYDIEFNDADPNDGEWRAIDEQSGEMYDPDKVVIHVDGPYVIDRATGLPVNGLVAQPGKVNAKVKLS